MQLGIFDRPSIELLWSSVVADVVDRDVVVDEPGEVGVRPVPLLLELDICRLPRPLVCRNVCETLHLLTSAALLVEVRNGLARILGSSDARKHGRGNECGEHGDDEGWAHPAPLLRYRMSDHGAAARGR